MTVSICVKALISIDSFLYHWINVL